MYKEAHQCRICGNQRLIPILDLGHQELTGVFPKNRADKITKGPLELVKCDEEDGKSCGLLQLRHSFELSEMYGLNYGYRSGLNRSMVDHLAQKAKEIKNLVSLKAGDLVVDIGSNDSTLLKNYPENLQLVGIDPSGKKFFQHYPSHIQLIPDFFSADTFRKNLPNKKAKVITSIAMFYDLEDPMDFMRQIESVLDDEGIWVFEQSYMPTMLEMNAYDTICHEHLEYYRLSQIKWMTDRVGLKIVALSLNDINGGSFSVTVSKTNSSYRECSETIELLLKKERELGLHTLKPYSHFKNRVFEHRDALRNFIKKANDSGKKVLGYGASTKGNVILQFCGFSEKDIPAIADVNPDKFGAFAPGTLIPIVSEASAKEMHPDYFLVLPWHFRKNLLEREKDFMRAGGKMFFPLPVMDEVGH